MRPRSTLWLLLAALGTQAATAQDGAVLRARIFQAEDRRAPSAAEISLLERSLRHPDSAVVLQAARALGRLERPALAAALFPLLRHRSGRIRAQAAEAVAQAAQGYRGDSSMAHRGTAWSGILAALSELPAVEREPAVAGALALSLGRLPYLTAGEIGPARAGLFALVRTAGDDRSARRDVTRGIEAMARATARRIPLETALVDLLRSLAAGDPDEATRRHALGALLLGQAPDPASITALLRSADPQSRRLAVTGLPRLPDDAERERLLIAALSDTASMVRTEALRAAARLAGPGACALLGAAVADPVSAVSLMAIDLLAGCGADTAAVQRLEALADTPAASWHPSAHALVSLARAAPVRAREAVLRGAAMPAWQSRMYAARAAALARDPATLAVLAIDSVANVREAAIAGLASVAGHAADVRYLVALGSSDYQEVMGAAAALGGTPARDEATAALLGALDRITRQRRETSRDARVAVLTRLHEVAGPGAASSLEPYLRDFDPVVADSAAAILGAWTGRVHRAAPVRPAPVPLTLAEADALRGMVFRFTLASGTFDVELYPEHAPATVARLAGLVRRRYYDGLTLHRDVPNFVLQGGSPGANEYMGDGPFMRDELGPLSHERGTLGVSTRGRDTGDGQVFVNLVDNPRLDFEYTVWGRVVSGWETVQAAREGEVILRVEIRPR